MNNITLSYSDTLSVDFTDEAWFNATAVAKHFNKETNDWLIQRETVEYIVRLADLLSEFKTCFVREFNKIIELDSTSQASRTKLLKLVKQTGFVKTKSGPSGHGGGSWLHPKLAVPFARWLDIGFSIWCDMQIEKILHPVQYGLKQLPPSPYISEPEAAQFMKSIQAHCKSNGGKYSALYKKVYDHYGITSYKHIPAGKLEEAARLCGIKLMKLVKSKIPDEIPLLTFTQDELDTLIAERIKAIEGELLPKETEPAEPGEKRFLIKIKGDRQTIEPVDINCYYMTEERFICHLKNFGYLVAKKDELNIGNMVLEHIPSRLLPIMIEVAGQRLRGIEAGKVDKNSENTTKPSNNAG